MEYETRYLSAWMKEYHVSAMELVRMCEISLATAYRIKNAKPVRDLDILYKVYIKLLEAGYYITWKEVSGIS